MPTYNGWNVIEIPATPPAPASIEALQMDLVAMSRGAFTGQQQTQDWQAGWTELSVTYPPMNFADAQPWVAFLRALKGVENVFQFPAAVCEAYPLELQGGSPVAALYFRLKQNSRKYTIDPDRYYRIQFEVIQAF